MFDDLHVFFLICGKPESSKEISMVSYVMAGVCGGQIFWKGTFARNMCFLVVNFILSTFNPRFSLRHKAIGCHSLHSMMCPIYLCLYEFIVQCL